MTAQTVLITGCSTGIGQDLARRLAHAGYVVIATARNPETLADLPVALQLPLDVTDPVSVTSATEEVIRHFGHLDILVNNAGYAVRGAVDEVPDQQVTQMFDVNVFGVIRMIRAVVPSMRRQAYGRIVNIGSIAGKLVLPVNGTYSATKFALEALSDAARLELAPFGIQVVLIEPGNIGTHFMATAQAHAQGILSNPTSPHLTLYQRYLEVSAALRDQEPGPEVVSRVVQRAIEAARPHARYQVAVPFTNKVLLHLGDPIKDMVFRRVLRLAASAERSGMRDNFSAAAAEAGAIATHSSHILPDRQSGIEDATTQLHDA